MLSIGYGWRKWALLTVGVLGLVGAGAAGALWKMGKLKTSAFQPVFTPPGKPLILVADPLDGAVGPALAAQAARTIVVRVSSGSVSDTLERLRWCASQVASGLTLDEVHRHVGLGVETPVNGIHWTFDAPDSRFITDVLPLLTSLQMPSTIFVRPGDVAEGRNGFGAQQLKAAAAEKGVSIGALVEIRPGLEVEAPTKLKAARTKLENLLGRPVTAISWGGGRADASLADAAAEAGFKCGFTSSQGFLEESSSLLLLQRIPCSKLEKAWENRTELVSKVPVSVFDVNIKDCSVRLEEGHWAGVHMAVVRGGQPVSWRGSVRKNVGEFVQDAQGVAGINGSFFADAKISGTSATMIGPCYAGNEENYVADDDAYRLTRLVNRPLVVWGPNRLAIVPFQPGTMNREELVRRFMPDFTDVFLGGAWIVHNGEPRPRELTEGIGAGDMQETRRRAFFGITKDGEIVVGGTLEVVSTERMARAAAEAGVYEAVLLDSGFSTSVVYDNRIIVTGHTAEHIPSRPVPHAILLRGTLELPTDENTLKVLAKAKPAVAVPGVNYYDPSVYAGMPVKKKKPKALPPDPVAVPDIPPDMPPDVTKPEPEKPTDPKPEDPKPDPVPKEPNPT
jgi:peptidoglycan/xylan/chitin deacetylase (PgdA/CDA1 family)